MISQNNYYNLIKNSCGFERIYAINNSGINYEDMGRF